MSNNVEVIQSKLSKFMRKYYTVKRVHGLFVFLTLFIFLTLFGIIFEYFFHLSVSNRTILFFTISALLLLTFIYSVILPLFKLFNILKRLSTLQASEIITNHFPEIEDRLLNTFQLI